jgi:hypothetical protein
MKKAEYRQRLADAEEQTHNLRNALRCWKGLYERDGYHLKNCIMQIRDLYVEAEAQHHLNDAGIFHRVLTILENPPRSDHTRETAAHLVAAILERPKD